MSIEKILTTFEPKKENLLAAIKKVNKEFGYVSEEAVKALANHFSLKKVAVYSAASFYDHINISQPASIVIRVCDGANCETKQSEKIIQEVERFFALKEGDEFDPKVRIKRESCMGLCEVGPVLEINGTVFERMTPGRVDEILRNYI